MRRRSTLVVPEGLHVRLRKHLFPGDGLEAAALLLCTIAQGRRRKFLVRDILLVPHNVCTRAVNRLTWPGAYVEDAIDRAESEGLAVFALHSHPMGFLGFSEIDDASDAVLMPALQGGAGLICGSAVMVPDGSITARSYSGSVFEPIDMVIVPGGTIRIMPTQHSDSQPPIAFTSGMTARLSQLSACVVGVSGTGSIVAEQLARLGFGEIILIDFDRIEARNLNRILNSAVSDIGALKVEVFARAIGAYRPDCDVFPISANIYTRKAVLAAADADVLFCCVDSSEGRFICDRIASALALPLFDVGVSIPTRRDAEGRQHIAEACGRIDYVFPGASTLADRKVYTPQTLEAEYLRRTAPDAYAKRVAEGYLRGLAEEAPAVIALNMRAASMVVMEFIARAFPFRHAENDRYARTIFMLGDGDEEQSAEGDFVAMEPNLLAAGLQEPLLGLPTLGIREAA